MTPSPKPNPFSKDYQSQIVLPRDVKVVKKIKQIPRLQQIEILPSRDRDAVRKMLKASI